MSLSLKIAFRYLFSKKSTQAINIISMVSMVGMGLGSFALIVLLSVFNGFEHLVLELQNSFYSDIEIKAKIGKTFEPSEDVVKILKSQQNIAAYSYVLEENAYLKYKENERLATVKGVDEHYYNTSKIEKNIVLGNKALTNKGINYAIMGSGIDYFLKTNVKNPIEPIQINIPKKGKTAAMVASQLFNNGQVMPGGIFLIQSEFDNKYMLVPIMLMRDITGIETAVSAIEIRLKDNENIAKAKKAFAEKLGNDFVFTARYEQDQSLYKAMRAERWAVFAILGFILFIISFNIVGSLSMVSLEKRRDISILKAMGLKKADVTKIFMLQGTLGALLGASIGLLLGLFILALQKTFGFISLPSNGGFVIDAYPVYIKGIDIVLSFVMVLFISMLASYYPAKKAAEQAFTFTKE